jgi:hypothetical protein
VEAFFGLFSNVGLELLLTITTCRAAIGCVLNDNSRKPTVLGRFLL